MAPCRASRGGPYRACFAPAASHLSPTAHGPREIEPGTRVGPPNLHLPVLKPGQEHTVAFPVATSRTDIPDHRRSRAHRGSIRAVS
eukprot:scaffold3759_cov425-Prasinococcus_capsulatus_cf.AAC.6